MSSQSEGNRARFFAQLTKTNPASAQVSLSNVDASAQPLDASSKALVFHSKTLSSEPKRIPNDSRGPILAISKKASLSSISDNSLDASEDEIIAQRTRTIETETLYKAKRESDGKLNLSGLLKRKDHNIISQFDTSQTARIEELEENNTRAQALTKMNSRRPKPVSFVSYPEPASLQRSMLPPSNQRAFDAPQNKYTTSNDDASYLPHYNSDTPHNLGDSSNQASTSDHIKGLTSSFNKKHSLMKDPAPIISIPTPATSRTYGSGVDSPQTPTKDSSTPGKIYPISPHPKKVIPSGAVEVFDGYNEFEPAEYEKRYSDFQPQLMSVTELGRRFVADEEDADEEGPPYKRRRVETPVNDNPGSLQMMPQSSDNEDRPNDKLQESRSSQEPPIFLGQDVDRYITEHMERYETARRRWTECSREEWTKGADELVERVTNVLNFVKDHVKRQVSVYASLHAQVDNQKKICDGTAEMLKNAQSEMVAKTGIVVESNRL